MSSTSNAITELWRKIIRPPTGLDPENEDAKRFDLLALNPQLALLKTNPGFERLRQRARSRGLLAEKIVIPMVRKQAPFIQDVLTDEWWQDVTVPMLESMRRRLTAWCNSSASVSQCTATFRITYGRRDGIHAFWLRRRHRSSQVHCQDSGVPCASTWIMSPWLKLRMNRSLTPTDFVELEHLLSQSDTGRP